MASHLTPTTSAAPEGVSARVRALRPRLTGALRRVADEVLEDPAGVARTTILELAERSETSPATVTRFCRVVGLRGYADLRLAVAAETGRLANAEWEADIGREIRPDDPLGSVLRTIVATDTRAIQDTAAQLDLDLVDRVVAAVVAAGRIDIYGMGSSGAIAAELQGRLHRVGIRVWAWSDVHAGLTSAALLAPGDVAVGVSHSGRTRETVDMLAEAAGSGATAIALTGFPHSPLTEVADLVLTTASHETRLHPDALAVRHSQLTVLDLVYVAVAQRIYDRAARSFAVTARAVDGRRLGAGHDLREGTP
ncbi:MAG: SIS domain-containing protein [Streptosporangiales bacterium]|nr:SIS domain-containing protein [Streptosporangiales bacterium]